MNQPPDYVANKFTFKNDFDTARINNDEGGCVFGSCCSVIKETKKEVYISPAQIITMAYFNKSSKVEVKSLKIQKNLASTNSVHKSFFKERSNVIE
jgi:hypothetical protein